MAVLQSRRRIHLFNAPDPFSGFVNRLGPVFWLPLTEQAGVIADNAIFAAAPGSELLTNPGNPFTFTGDALDSWNNLSESGSDPEITERDSGQLNAGTNGTGGSVNLYSSATNFASRIQQVVMTVGDTYRLRAMVSAINSNPIMMRDNANGIALAFTTTGLQEVSGIAANASFEILGWNSPPNDATLDYVSVVKVGEVDGLIAGTTTLAQTGLRGPHHAYLFDGATSRITVYNRASIQGLTEFTLWALFNPSSAGEGDAGALFSKADEFDVRFNSSSRDLIATVHYDTTDAQVVTSTTLVTDEWHTVGLRIVDTSKQIGLFIDGVEASYASEQTGVGSRVSNTNNLIVGNNAAVNQTLAGLLDDVLLIDRALTNNEFALLNGLL